MTDFFSTAYLEKQYDLMAQSYNDNRHLFDNSAQLEELAQPLLKNGYGEYLMDLLRFESESE